MKNLTVLFLFLCTFSCTPSEHIDISPPPPTNLRVAISDVLNQANASSLFTKDEIGPTSERRNGENTCRCYMRVESITPVNYGSNPPWFLYDVTGGNPNPSQWAFEGFNMTTWRDFPNTQNLPLPTPYVELESPSTGVHMFYAGGVYLVPPDYENGENLLIEVSYRCSEGNNTVPTTGTFTFDLANDGVNDPIDENLRIVFATFACLPPADTPNL